MLLKALITRLNDGTNTSSSRVSSSHRRLSSLVYDKYQNLPDLLIRMLRAERLMNTDYIYSKSTQPDSLVLQAQRVFPALEIIEQSGIPKWHRAKIQDAVWNHLEGSVWPIREKAAKTLSYLPVSEHVEDEMLGCLQRPSSTQNALHGRHLYLRSLFARVQPNTDGEPLFI